MYHTENKHGLPYQLDRVKTDNIKQEIIDNDTEVKDDNSARPVKHRKPEDDNSINFQEEVYVETMNVVKCYICDLTWEDEDQVNLHYSLMHMPSCTICGARFKEEAELKTHIEDYLDSSRSSFVPGINACEKCDDEPKAKTDLRSHI